VFIDFIDDNFFEKQELEQFAEILEKENKTKMEVKEQLNMVAAHGFEFDNVCVDLVGSGKVDWVQDLWITKTTLPFNYWELQLV